MEYFEECSKINELINLGKQAEARNRLIYLLDLAEREQRSYSQLLNHLVRATGLYPYLKPETASWEDRFAFESFKVDIGRDEPVTLHSEQSLVLKHLLNGEDLAVSAPTSFGKSLIIDAYIAIKRPQNIVIVVPTIALTDETRRRLNKKFSQEYKIITTSDVPLGNKNIFIFPQERAIGYAGKLQSLDFLVIDEFYKAGRDFDKERSPGLLKAMLKLGDKAKQRYYLAPNIAAINDSPFTAGMRFLPLDFNTVFLEKHEEYRSIGKSEQKKNAALLGIIGQQKTKSLIYAGTYPGVDSVTTLLSEKIEKSEEALLASFSSWLAANYHPNWKLTNLVRRKVGVHTGQLHRSLSQIQVRLFEEENGLQTLVSTSSIIEGVNTSAENVIVWSNKKGKLKLDDFSYRNIIGRGGRMFRHFVGKIYILEEPPLSSDIQLSLALPDELLADLDEEKFKRELTKEQLAKLLHYKDEMVEIMGQVPFEQLQQEGQLVSSDTDLLGVISRAIKNDEKLVRGLQALNSDSTDYWVWILCKILKLIPGGWDTTYTKFSEFVRALTGNWRLSIPELLDQLAEYDVTIEDFFKMERNATFKLTALLNDINVIQKKIAPQSKVDISPFISRLSRAFLPSCVMELEEYGLPRMLARRIQEAGIVDFEDENLKLHAAVELLIQNKGRLMRSLRDITCFEAYVLEHFYDGIEAKGVLSQ